MATNTPNYQLRKPAGVDVVNVVTDIGDNMDDIDTNLKRVDDAALAAEVNNWTRIVSSAGTYLTTSGTTELNLPKLAVENINVVLSRTYHFNIRFFVSNPTVGDDFFVRVRKDTATSGPIILEWPCIMQVSGIDHCFNLFGSWLATGNDADGDFYVSAQRVVGTGTIAIQGDRKSQLHMFTRNLASSNTVES